MAAVTQNNPVRYNVNGSWREQYYNITIANSGDTLLVGLTDVVTVDASPDNGITAITITPNTPNAGSTIAFTTTGTPLTGLMVTVRGH